MTTDEIKALRMKLAAKKVKGHARQGGAIGAYRSAKPFNEKLHPRGAGGKFASKPDAPKASLREQVAAHRKTKGEVGYRLQALRHKIAEREPGVKREFAEVDKAHAATTKRIVAANTAEANAKRLNMTPTNKDVAKREQLNAKYEEQKRALERIRRRKLALEYHKSRIHKIGRKRGLVTEAGTWL